jgi:hypothetical protein
MHSEGSSMTHQLRLYTGDDEVAVPPLDATPSQQETNAHAPVRNETSPTQRTNRDRADHRGRGQTRQTNCTEAQRRAIFAGARRAGLAIEELRDLCPNHSVSKLTVAQAADLLTRLNQGTRYHREKPPRKPRRPTGTIALVSDGQRSIIARFRIALGWTPDMLTSHLQARKYPNQTARTMDQITTQFHAQAVIEHLKIILQRTLYYHGKKLGREVPALDDPRNDAVKGMMANLQPHDRLCDLYTDRIKRLTRRLGESQRITESRLASQKRGDGRCLSAIATCADMAEAVLYLEQELARTPIPSCGTGLPTCEQRSVALAINS